MFDLTDIGFVKRIMVGSRDPEAIRSEEQIERATELLNRCLHHSPRGRVLGIEKTFNLLNIGEHQVVLQCLTYHVGWTRRPPWLEE